MKKNALTVLGPLLMLGTSQVFANCTALESALKSAPQQMSNLKQGRYDADDPSTFNTFWRWGNATSDDCMITYDEDNGYDLACLLDASTLDAAKSMSESTMSTVESCLKGSGRRYKTTPLTFNGGRYPGYNGNFTVEHSDTQDIEVRVRASCRTNYKGLEKCSSSITIELTGDEKE